MPRLFLALILLSLVPLSGCISVLARAGGHSGGGLYRGVYPGTHLALAGLVDIMPDAVADENIAPGIAWTVFIAAELPLTLAIDTLMLPRDILMLLDSSERQFVSLQTSSVSIQSVELLDGPKSKHGYLRLNLLRDGESETMLFRTSKAPYELKSLRLASVSASSIQELSVVASSTELVLRGTTDSGQPWVIVAPTQHEASRRVDLWILKDFALPLLADIVALPVDAAALALTVLALPIVLLYPSSGGRGDTLRPPDPVVRPADRLLTELLGESRKDAKRKAAFKTIP